MRKVANFEKMGKRLREARRKAKMTQVQLAAACDCDPKHISAIETGTKHSSFDLLLIASTQHIQRKQTRPRLFRWRWNQIGTSSHR